MQLRIDLSGLNAAVAEMFLLEETDVVSPSFVTSPPLQDAEDVQAWQDLMAYADSSLHGFLQMCRQHQLPLPELGLDIQDDKQEIIANAELSWFDKKVAILLDDEDGEVLKQYGWHVFAAETLNQNEASLLQLLR